MADVYTGTSALTTDVATAWSKVTYKALRPQLFWDRFATEKGTTDHNAAAVAFTLWADLAAATTALTEAADVDAVPLSTSTVSVTLTEYGNAAIPTAKVRATSFINIDPDVANIVGFNAGVSLDTIARDVAVAGTNVIYATGGASTPTSRTTVAVEDTISLDDIRLAVARLRTANVQPFDGDSYAGIIHPHVSYDLRSETGLTHFSDPVAYSDPERRWNGEIGKVEGVRFMESPRAGLFANASDGAGAAGNIDVYATNVFGKEGIAKAFSSAGGYTGGNSPTVVIADKADNLNRFRAVGWKWLGGFGILRQDALQRIESSSSIGANS